MIMMRLRLKRSATLPAMGERRIRGRLNASAVIAIGVALPVWVKTQTLKPNPVRPDPTMEMNCPSQMIRKVDMFLGWCLGLDRFSMQDYAPCV